MQPTVVTDLSSMNPQSRYLFAVADLLRARVEELSQMSRCRDMLIFIGKRKSLVEVLNQRWDELPDRENLPNPCEILSWL